MNNTLTARSIMAILSSSSLSISHSLFSSLFLILLVVLSCGSIFTTTHAFPIEEATVDEIKDFPIEEATIDDIKNAFRENKLTSTQLVEFYRGQISRRNSSLRGIIEVNPDASSEAVKADEERAAGKPNSMLPLHGIPILLKDNIATKDKLNTTAGSYALLGSVVPRDAFVVTKLRSAGAIIFGKASMSEWAGFRGGPPDGWCARSGQGRNPYNLSAYPCGSSSGSAISVAANMVAVSLGTETDGSILCPSSSNSAVGIKPTVGLTSRSGVIPISHRQDSVGPITRSVADAVYVLDAIVGSDPKDPKTQEAAGWIPSDGYKKFLNSRGLNGKRLGILRSLNDTIANGTYVNETFERHIQTLRQQGAVLVDNLEIPKIDVILDPNVSGENLSLSAEFKVDLKAYLGELEGSSIKSLEDVIKFNKNNPKLEMTTEYGQGIFEYAQNTYFSEEQVREALSNLTNLSRDGLEKLMKDNNLDAVVAPGLDIFSVLAIGGFPGITVPAGYDRNNNPFGIFFGGLKGTEPKLIEIAYGFEQATKVRRKPPTTEPKLIEIAYEIEQAIKIRKPLHSSN
ncbi:Amidase family protein [Melia azedarach]|uniref:Amidase family protein n=1 Tax=Melia azedarach TaxID=155640 RepID=A0ACC1XZ70_MELAZ|nr:Amidase family protein [Melia azedarach]